MVSSYGIPTPQEGQRVFLLLSLNGSQPTIVEFEINPDSLNKDLPSRITTQTTIAGAYQDNWGPGVGKIQFGGTTGWRRKKEGGLDGFQLYTALEGIHIAYQNFCAENDPSKANLQIILPPGDFTVPTSATQQVLGLVSSGQLTPTALSKQFGFYRVSSDDFQGQRSIQIPLLFRYQWQMTILQDMLQQQVIDPSKRFILDPTFSVSGDPFSNPGSPPTSTGGSGSGNPGPQNVSPSGHGTDINVTPQQIQAAENASALATGIPQDALPGGSPATIGEIVSSFPGGMTLLDLEVYNQQVMGNPIGGISGNDTVPAGWVIFIPSQNWLQYYHQQNSGG